MPSQFLDPPPKLDLPPPEFSVGDKVRVRVSDTNRTRRTGVIRSSAWHFKEKRHYYYIEQDGKPVKKRYFANDLERVPD
jgi:hypothetical protein